MFIPLLPENRCSAAHAAATLAGHYLRGPSQTPSWVVWRGQWYCRAAHGWSPAWRGELLAKFTRSLRHCFAVDSVGNMRRVEYWDDDIARAAQGLLTVPPELNLPVMWLDGRWIECNGVEDALTFCLDAARSERPPDHSIAQFFADCIRVSQSAADACGLFVTYCDWCVANGYRVMPWGWVLGNLQQVFPRLGVTMQSDRPYLLRISLKTRGHRTSRGPRCQS
jgi:hypothetical protein